MQAYQTETLTFLWKCHTKLPRDSDQKHDYFMIDFAYRIW